VSGTWYKLHSRIVHPYLPHVSGTDGSLLSSTHSIMTMYNSMHPISISGYNITIQATSPHPRHQWQHTSSDLPTHRKPMPRNCHWFPSTAKVNLTHSDTYIHKPFNFAAAHGQQTRDCIGKANWDAILSHTSMFSKPLPSLDLPSYSIHVECRVHVSYCNISSVQLLLSAATDDNANPVYL
jgi:hypothetical protein